MIATLRRHASTPVLARDVRVRMRRRRTAALLAGSLAATVVAALVAYGTSVRGGGDPRIVAHAATALFRAAAATSVVLVATLGVALGAASISGEVERATLDGLRATTLPPWRLCLGKLLDVVLVLVLVALAPLPLFGIALYLGGVEPATVGALLLACLGTGLITAAAGVACSTAAPSTPAATAAAAAVMLVLGALPFALGMITPQSARPSGTCSALLCPVDGAPTAAVVAGSASPLAAAVPLFDVEPGTDVPGSDWWRVALAVDAGGAALLVAVSAAVVRMRRWPS